MTYEEFKEKVGSVILTGEGSFPVTPVVQMLQGKWKLQILYELCIKCPMRFGELKKMLKPITNTALTNALKELEADDLIQRIQYNGDALAGGNISLLRKVVTCCRSLRHFPIGESNIYHDSNYINICMIIAGRH